MKNNSQSGFTLIELLLCIIVLGGIGWLVLAVFSGGVGFNQEVYATGRVQMFTQLNLNGSRNFIFVTDPQTHASIQEFEVKDDRLRGIYDSGATLSSASSAKNLVCRVEGIGKRVKVLSWFPTATGVFDCYKPKE